MQLKLMSLDRLVGLREEVEAALKARIAGARSELESRLNALSEFGGAQVGRLQRTLRRSARGRVPPKYRNPDNPSETWTGRGLPPRWLAAELKRGGRLEDFLIEGEPKRRRKAVAKARGVKAARKQAKPRKAAARARKTAKPRKAAKSRQAAKSRKTAKPPRVKIARGPPAAHQPPAPAPAPTGESVARNPGA
jgi:DNA-binding protein H-NS